MKKGSMESGNDSSSGSTGRVAAGGDIISERDMLRIPAWRRWIVQWDISHNAIPLAFFAFTAMWQTIGNHLMSTLPETIYIILFYVSCIIFTLTLSLFLVRVCLCPRLVAFDFHHPRLMNFFYIPVIVGSLFILTVPKATSAPDNIPLFRVAFYVLGTYQVCLSLYMFGDWLFGSHPTKFIHPLVFMQTIGYFLTSNLAARATLTDLAAAMLYIGTLFWLLVFITNFQHVSLALDKQRERPSPPFFLFIAPPAQAAIATIMLHFALDPSAPAHVWPPLADAFLYVDLFMYALMFRLFPTFWTSKFNVSSWAYIFPLSGASAVIIAKFTATDLPFWQVLSFITGALASVAMLIVLALTVRSLSTGQTPKNPASLKVYARYYLKRRAVVPVAVQGHGHDTEEEEEEEEEVSAGHEATRAEQAV